MRHIFREIILYGTIAMSLAAMAVGQESSPASTPRPEHPNPQMMRAEWLNLNGPWEFGETDDGNDSTWLTKQKYPDKIIVPYCRESKLSGLERKGFVKNVWYRRTFQKPADWKSERVRLHIGACDWKTTVWVNGMKVGEHLGGSAPICFDISDAITSGDNTIVIHAFDDTRSGVQALGKQSAELESHDCLYTRTTGIWQTVWLEGVGATFVSNVRVEADLANTRAIVHAEVDGSCDGLTLQAVAMADGCTVATTETSADWRNNRLVLNLSEKRPWSIECPFLYDLKLVLLKDGEPVDEVRSYFGLREVTIRGTAILLNDKPVFQRLVLDQGFYPDGIWTAPSDEALRNDIKLSMAIGFNGARLHQKVFEPRFLYWADKLGYIVWGEFPCWGLNYNKLECNLPVIDEWTEVVRRDYNHPSIVGWCPFNETPKEAIPLQNTIVKITRAIDPARPVIDTSGFTHGFSASDIFDLHDYNQQPDSFRATYASMWAKTAIPLRYVTANDKSILSSPFFVSEFGGIGWSLTGGWGYGDSPKTLDDFYKRFQGLVDAQLDNPHLFGYCYTQLTNVEQEQNGLYDYHRKPKFDVERLRRIQSRPAAYEKNPPTQQQSKNAVANWRVLVGANQDGTLAKSWRYTTKEPGANWVSPDFDAGVWKLGRGGFGKSERSAQYIGTPWNTSDIWLRQKFTCKDATFHSAMLIIYHDDAAEVYLNGKPIWNANGWIDQYQGFDVTKTVRGALVAGENTIAVHCHQDLGDQFLDMALLIGDNAANLAF